MALLHIDLQDGFHHDDVRLSVHGEEVYRRSDVTTRMQIGRADNCEVTVDEGEAQIDVELPSREVAETIAVEVTGTIYVGVSLTRDGDVTHRVSSEPFRYL